jgi:hypothetical protein
MSNLNYINRVKRGNSVILEKSIRHIKLIKNKHKYNNREFNKQINEKINKIKELENRVKSGTSTTSVKEYMNRLNSKIYKLRINIQKLKLKQKELNSETVKRINNTLNVFNIPNPVKSRRIARKKFINRQLGVKKRRKSVSEKSSLGK